MWDAAPWAPPTAKVRSRLRRFGMRISASQRRGTGIAALRMGAKPVPAPDVSSLFRQGSSESEPHSTTEPAEFTARRCGPHQLLYVLTVEVLSTRTPPTRLW